MEFSRQQSWSGFPFPSPGDLPNPGIKPGSLALQADTLLSELPGKPLPEKMAYGTQPGSPPPNLHLYDSKEWFSLLFFKVFTCAQPLQSCPTLCDPMDCSSPGSPVHGTLQARTLEWVSISSSRRLLYPGIEPRSLCLVNRQAGSLPPVPPYHKDVDTREETREAWKCSDRTSGSQGCRQEKPTTTKCHELGGLHDRDLSPCSSGGQKSKIRVWTRFLLSESCQR